MSPTSGSWDKKGTSAVLGNVLIWGSTPVLLKLLTTEVDAWTANGIRYPIAALLLLPFVLMAARRGDLDRSVYARAFVPAFFAFTGQVLWALAPYYLEANLIGFLIKTSTIWAIFGAMILFADERPLLRSSIFWIGFAICVIGCVVLAYEKGAFDAGAGARGIQIILGCSALFGLYAVAVRRFMSGISPVVSFGVVAQYVSVGTIVLACVYGEEGAFVGLSAKGWILSIVTAICGVCISHMLFYVAVLRLGATITASVQMLSPFVTYAFGVAVLGETLELVSGSACIWLVIGGFVILASQRLIAKREAETDA